MVIKPDENILIDAICFNFFLIFALIFKKFPKRIDMIKKYHYIIRMAKKMDENKLLERITYDPKIFNGKPIIRGKRIAVEHILGMIAEGSTIDELLAGYPFLEKNDIQAVCNVF